MAKPNVYDAITDKLIAQLEKGVSPWQKPWQGGKTNHKHPVRFNGERYSGINVVLLWMEQDLKGYTNNRWMTYKQAEELGAQVRKGEKGTMVVYASTFTKEVEVKGQTQDKTIPFMKAYFVFNTDQIDGLPAKYVPAVEPVAEVTPLTEAARIAHAEQFFKHCKSTVNHGGNRAFYRHSSDLGNDGDFIQMPEFATFKSPEDYYSTLGHEHIHWTGDKSRLARTFGKRFGDDQYAVEELVAELGAAFLCSHLELSNDEPRADHAQYLASWIKVLKGDNRAIFTAAGAAQKAVDFLCKLQPVAEELADAA